MAQWQTVRLRRGRTGCSQLPMFALADERDWQCEHLHHNRDLETRLHAVQLPRASYAVVTTTIRLQFDRATTVLRHILPVLGCGTAA